jgi:uncharacterized protein DUF4272
VRPLVERQTGDVVADKSLLLVALSDSLGVGAEPGYAAVVSTSEFPPPSQAQVASRLLCLAAIATLGAAAQDLQAGLESDHCETFAVGVRDWVRGEGLLEQLAPSELAVFEKPLDAWTKRELVNASWRGECIGVLMWALSCLAELPGYDQQFVGLLERIPVLETTAEFVVSTELRPWDALSHARDLAELWHWRSRTTQLSKDPSFLATHADGYLSGIVGQTAQKAYAVGDTPQPIGDDFPWRGKAYRDLNEDDYSLATSIAIERHFALNWLCGEGETWDETPTDT